ncbi:Uncharacterised protein [Megamonas hypermegale]|uniref:Uncharacterized protein n=1 Tax=Megamonas hypermegale TaxID=158847 RepID=A0A378NS48_9FIRM|nr:hypothetical protein [Megamonas hypermegale]STY71202.1 Uncharacterised protein [Megamonas hypermegale]
MFTLNKIKFFCTKKVNDLSKNSINFKLEMNEAIEKFLKEDWGDISKEDFVMNDKALKTGDRIIAKYKCKEYKDIYIIADTVLNNNAYEHASILFVDEY